SLPDLSCGFLVEEPAKRNHVLYRSTPGEGIDEVVDQLASPLLKLWRQAVQIFQDLFFDSGLNHDQYLRSAILLCQKKYTGTPSKKIPVPISALRVSVK